MRKSKVFQASLIILMLLFSNGCGGNMALIRESPRQEDIVTTVEAALEERHGDSFSVTKIEERTEGGPFSNTYYFGTCRGSDNTEPFDFRIEKDGTRLLDNYEGTLYREKALEELKEILKEDAPEFSDFSVDFAFSDKHYGSFEDYKKAGMITLGGSYTIDAPDAEAAVDQAYLLLEDLRAAGYGNSITLKWGDRQVSLFEGSNGDRISKEELVSRFKK